jgi:hypothetical protein
MERKKLNASLEVDASSSVGTGNSEIMNSSYPAPCNRAERRRLHTLRQFQSNCNVSHSTTYKLLHSGQLRAVKVLGRTMITDEEQERFLANLPTYGDVASP